MTTDKDMELVRQLIEATEQGRVSWHPTATINEFTSSFRGRFRVLVGKLPDESYFLRVLDETERELLKIEYQSGGSVVGQYADPVLSLLRGEVRRLFEIARRDALHVEEVIDDILGELKGKPG